LSPTEYTFFVKCTKEAIQIPRTIITISIYKESRSAFDPVNGPDVVVNFAQQKFDVNGNLVDQDTRKFLGQLLQNLVNWTKRLKVEQPSST
jgi:hypothetical protein